MPAYTVAELAKADPFPAALTTSGHLVWNSPATIDFNSPGAQGFGVKRAGLTIPGSLMLLISPAACGRNTNALSGSGHYGERFAYLELTSTDIVTGAHLSKISEAARLFLASRKEPPSCLLLCTTCVDALLGTDMDGVCRSVEAAIHVPVRPCYMYALTRESLHPPMVQVRETICSLLQPRKKNPHAVNLLGYFSPMDEHSELFSLLRVIGIRTIRQIATCKTYDEFQAMAKANFNLVLHPDALPAAESLATRLKIPFITLQRFYTPKRIHKQYQAMANIVHANLTDNAYDEALRTAMHHFQGRKLTISLGSRLNADPLELAIFLVSCGFHIASIFTTLAPSDRPFLKLLADVSPDTELYGSLSPSLASFDATSSLDLTIGADAAIYYPDVPNLPWNEECQPFGYQAASDLLNDIASLLERTPRR